MSRLAPRSPSPAPVILMALATMLTGFAVQRAGEDLLAASLIIILGGAVLALLWQNSQKANRAESENLNKRDHWHLEAVWHHAPLGIFLLDPHDSEKVIRILDCNQTACDMHGYSREELIGQPLDTVEVTPWNQWREQWFAGLQKEKILRGESEHRRKDGSVFPTEYFTSLIELDGEELVIGMDVDATERKAAESAMLDAKEQAELADRAKSEFLAVMSHEIRTPMNGIIGFTNLLYDTELNSEQRDWLATIRSSGETLLTLINDILDFSKIESGKLEMDLQPTRLARCIEEVVDLLWSKANEKQIELLVWIDPQIPDWATTDITRFRQIVLNLVGNAIKFTPSGEVEIRLEPTPSAEKDATSKVSVTVRDTGVGIPADRVERLFKPFSQADSSTTREYGGTGLGLVISRRLAELLGGEVQLLKTNHDGSTFRLTVEAPACAAPLGKPVSVYLDEDSANLKDKRVLIVDDNETNCRILHNLAERWKMKSETFADPRAAVSRLTSGAPCDIILVDMMMPHMNGIEFAQTISTDATGKDTPMILISSVGQDELRKMGDVGVFGSILHKPLRQSALHDAIVNALGQKTEKPAPIEPESSRFDSQLATTHPLDILVAEDNPVNRKLITRLLERLGYRPELTENGRECITALTLKPFDVVLMDCQMPVLDGYDATTRIRAGAAGVEYRELPIIALTAAAMVGDRERCLGAGMNDYLTKPVQPESLIKVLKTITRRSEK